MTAYFDNVIYGRVGKDCIVELEYLLHIFKKLTGRKFDEHERYDERLMQNAMMILQSQGVTVARAWIAPVVFSCYEWSTVEHKLYTLALTEDLHRAKFDDIEPFSRMELKLMSNLRKEIKGKPVEFLDCLGIVYYCCWHSYRSRSDKSDVVAKAAEILQINPTAPVLDEAWDACMRLMKARESMEF